MKSNLFLLMLIISFKLFFLKGMNYEEQIKGPVIAIVATRPDGIKMAPVYHAFKRQNVPIILCSTDQHTDLLNDVFEIFDMHPDIHLKVMKPGQDLFHITTAVLKKIRNVFLEKKPSLVLVQGDTSSAMIAALAAFYLKIPIGHVEAGLRTKSIYAPFPEEFNRRVISLIASYHFAPTEIAYNKLIDEGIDQSKIFYTGNTVVDSLQFIKEKFNNNVIRPSENLSSTIKNIKNNGKKLFILTAHRRESFGTGLKSIFNAIKKSIGMYPDLHFIYPVHPNPAIKEALQGNNLHEMKNNITIVNPLSYIDMVYLLLESDGIVTDSGGLQEEGISLNKPVIVLREETERPEGVLCGLSVVVGTNEDKIVDEIGKIVNGHCVQKRSKLSIYGDGDAGHKISLIVRSHIEN